MSEYMEGVCCVSALTEPALTVPLLAPMAAYMSAIMGPLLAAAAAAAAQLTALQIPMRHVVHLPPTVIQYQPPAGGRSDSVPLGVALPASPAAVQALAAELAAASPAAAAPLRLGMTRGGAASSSSSTPACPSGRGGGFRPPRPASTGRAGGAPALAPYTRRPYRPPRAMTADELTRGPAPISGFATPLAGDVEAGYVVGGEPYPAEDETAPAPAAPAPAAPAPAPAAPAAPAPAAPAPASARPSASPAGAKRPRDDGGAGGPGAGSG